MTNSSIVLLEAIETPLTRFLSSFPDLSELFNLPMVSWLICSRVAKQMLFTCRLILKIKSKARDKSKITLQSLLFLVLTSFTLLCGVH